MQIGHGAFHRVHFIYSVSTPFDAHLPIIIICLSQCFVWTFDTQSFNYQSFDDSTVTSIPCNYQRHLESIRVLSCEHPSFEYLDGPHWPAF